LAGAAFLAAAFLRLGAAFFFIGVTWYSFLLLWCCLVDEGDWLLTAGIECGLERAARSELHAR
jgi:hypothetical protein